MGQTPRNPRYFPKMKVRGARRRGMAPLQRMTGAFDRLTVVSSKTVWEMEKLLKVLAESK